MKWVLGCVRGAGRGASLCTQRCPQHRLLRLSLEIHLLECSAAAQQAAAEQLSPLATFVVNRSLSQVFPVNLLAVLKAEDTKLSIPKAICDPSDLLASRHANALALQGLHDIVL